MLKPLQCGSMDTLSNRTTASFWKEDIGMDVIRTGLERAPCQKEDIDIEPVPIFDTDTEDGPEMSSRKRSCKEILGLGSQRGETTVLIAVHYRAATELLHSG